MLLLRKPTFEAFYQAHIDQVFRFIYFRVSLRRELAEDLTSEIFIKALAHFDRYDPNQSQHAWIMTIARNHLYNYFRDRKQDVDLEEVAFSLADRRSAGPDLIDSEHLLVCLNRLTADERRLVEMKHLEGYRHQDIAQILGKSAGAVRVELHRVMKKLKVLFAQSYESATPSLSPARSERSTF